MDSSPVPCFNSPTGRTGCSPVTGFLHSAGRFVCLQQPFGKSYSYSTDVSAWPSLFGSNTAIYHPLLRIYPAKAWRKKPLRFCSHKWNHQLFLIRAYRWESWLPRYLDFMNQENVRRGKKSAVAWDWQIFFFFFLRVQDVKKNKTERSLLSIIS